jgi:hypothetical protein
VVAEEEEARVKWCAVIVAAKKGINALQLAVGARLEVATRTQARRCQYGVKAGIGIEAYS